MLVQIYEVRTPEEAVALARLGVDHIGVLVGGGAFPRELPTDRVRAIFAATPPGTRRVALSLSADAGEVARATSPASAESDNATRRVPGGVAAKIARTRSVGSSRGKAPPPTSTPI